MHPNPRRIAPIVLVIVIIAAAAYWYFGVRPAQADNGAITASGTIEATQIHISPELGGRVAEVKVDEGNPVKTGDVLIQFDTALLGAQRAQAEAAVNIAKANADAAQANTDAANAQLTAAQTAQSAAQAAHDAAQANLDLLKAGATAEQIAAAEAQLAQAEANRQATQASYYALVAGARPEDVAAAQARLEWARHEYFSMTVALSTRQIEDVRTALTTAQSNLTRAEARKADLEKDSRTPPSALDAASTAIVDAQTALDAARQAYDAVQDSTRPFYRQIEALRKSWEIAQLNLAQAKAHQRTLQADNEMIREALDAAQSTVDDAQKMVDDAKAAYDALASGDQAQQLRSAWDEVQRAQTTLNALGRAPGSAPLEAVLNQVDAATAVWDMADANLANLKNGARPEQITAAQAQVDAAQANLDTTKANVDSAKARADGSKSQAVSAKAQVDAAQAALNAIEVQIAKMTITAPADGVVLSRSIEPGEVASPGASLLTLGQLGKLTITVYIPEDRYGEINLGEAATVTVDSFPGEKFTATVTHIADKAEFTPRNVQTAEGRRTTVFAVKLSIDNADSKLKPGMPADVAFGK